MVGVLPIRGKRAEVAARLEERRDQGERALDYVRLYGAYAETEAVFDDRRLRALWESLDADDQAAFCFDTTVIDWRHYVQVVHLPSVVQQARVRTTGGAREGPVPLRAGQAGHPLPRPPHRRLRPREHPHRVQRGRVATPGWPPAACPTTSGPGSSCACCARARACSPSTAGTGATSSATSTAATRARRADRSGPTPGSCSATCCSPSRSRPASAGCGSTGALGHRTVLITGALDFVVEPLRPLFDDIVCARLARADGRFTGELVDAPPTGEARALRHGRLRRGRGAVAGGVGRLRRLGQ